ncbi:MAG: Acetylornithine aminotransferase [Evtepia sp.]|jgi:acetylornithine/N-succinyldiaminopimelate aminotransferase|nr:Acetylornithine aminotransferase [Evtepia sp.]
MNAKDLMALDEQYMMKTCHRYRVDIDHGQGATLFDSEGREYIDFTSGMGENSIGYGNEQWAESIMEQTLKLGSTSQLFYTQPCAQLAEKLCRQTGMASACFVSSAPEANAVMMQLARKYSFDRYGMGRSTVLTLQHSFSRETDPLSVIGQPLVNEESNSHMGALHFVTPDMEEIQKMASHDVCAVMLELIQTDGNTDPLPRKFVHALAVFCAEQDWLLLINEAQTGAGRTGTMFAFQQYGILPDAISFAGGLSGGLPLGGVLANNRCKEVLKLDSQRFAFGANPICAAAALTVLDILNENTLAQVKEKGDYLRSGIESLNLPTLGQIHGVGLMIGVTLSEGKDPISLASLLADYGLLCLATKEGLLFLPPLLVTKEELDRGLAILKQALGEGA